MTDFASIDDLQVKLDSRPVVEVEAAGLRLRAKTPTAREWSSIRQQLAASQREDDPDKAAALFASAECQSLGLLCDEQGRKWLTEDQLEGFIDSNGAAVSEIAEAVLEATGLSGDGMEQALKNSGETAGGGSPTA